MLYGCQSLTLGGTFIAFQQKKAGRIAAIQLQTAQGSQTIKASKWFRLVPQWSPQPGESIEISILKTVKAGKVKIKAFAVGPGAGSLPPSLEMPTPDCIAVCQSKGCGRRGSNQLQRQITAAIQSAGLDSRLRVISTDCLGECKGGPAVQLQPTGQIFTRPNPQTLVHAALGSPADAGTIL
ncbi:(2Fe-2S) ferredoxin domain-containing protein [Lyngbya confervoides]|uniref:(2Fe-2S) ferredoxin domain-containing protein n=1 Tax=Lyngbya confervoides BDU141951 TaxID=1574623 RepID=A0ABD4T2H1_9CYAN|nr:(2Fe-2S) ferredoxin domain-containing protein [Lyngbya confervoides]MCM1982893.1 (2Fe-2S) ferredoxin domain-containing protein [Lyngbya confervoides BDU141951]